MIKELRTVYVNYTFISISFLIVAMVVLIEYTKNGACFFVIFLSIPLWVIPTALVKPPVAIYPNTATVYMGDDSSMSTIYFNTFNQVGDTVKIEGS